MESFSMFAMIPLMYGIRSVEWTEERVFIARVVFAILQIIVIGILLYIKMKIKNSPNDTKINVPKPSAPFSTRYIFY